MTARKLIEVLNGLTEEQKDLDINTLVRNGESTDSRGVTQLFVGKNVLGKKILYIADGTKEK